MREWSVKSAKKRVENPRVVHYGHEKVFIRQAWCTDRPHSFCGGRGHPRGRVPASHQRSGRRRPVRGQLPVCGRRRRGQQTSPANPEPARLSRFPVWESSPQRVRKYFHLLRINIFRKYHRKIVAAKLLVSKLKVVFNNHTRVVCLLGVYVYISRADITFSFRNLNRIQ